SGIAAGALIVPDASRSKPSLRVLSQRTGEELTTIDLPTGERFGGGVRLIAPSPDGKTVVVRTGGKGWAVADAKTGKLLHTGEAEPQPSQVAAISADGSAVLLHVGGAIVKGYEVKKDGKT